MMREFSVVYQAPGESPRNFSWFAEDAATARRTAEATLRGTGIVLGASEIRPVIDWQHQRNFTIEEAAVYLRRGYSTIENYMAQGLLPKARQGRPVFTRDQLDKLIHTQMDDPHEPSRRRTPIEQREPALA